MKVFLFGILFFSAPTIALIDFASIAELSVKHLQEHLQGRIDVKENADKKEREFLYFNMIDEDKDMQIDGVEISKFFGSDMHENNRNTENMSWERMEARTDEVIRIADKDKDGRISYSEYVIAIESDVFSH